jgi:hypothetical protein
MSKERDLLQEKSGLKPEPMSNFDLQSAMPSWYNQDQRDAFELGIRWYEKYVGKVGVYDDE